MNANERSVYIGYKFQGSDFNRLRTKLITVSDTLSGIGCSTYIHWRDGQNWVISQNTPAKNQQIITSAFKKIDECDVLFALTDSKKLSEGLLLEIGRATASHKRFILACKTDTTLRFSRALADQVIEYTSLEDLVKKIKINRGVFLTL